MNLKFNTIQEDIHDSLLDVRYNIIRVYAQDLSKYLKANLKREKIDYEKYNSAFDKENSYRANEDKDSVESPPLEIYEYQNFFLLEKQNGDFILLDGFRRLLWYNTPDTIINVRVYKESSLSASDILTLMINLNHFKFYGGSGSYQDRGFALLLRTVFGLNIYKYRDAFDGYLNGNDTKNSYSHNLYRNRSKGATVIKNRIINPHFTDDIRFIEGLSDSGNCMVNSFLGTLLFNYREKYPDTILEADVFLQKQSQYDVLKDLILKYNKVGTNSSAESQKVTNRILEIYENIIKSMVGLTVEKSYAELLVETKALSAQLAKDKKMIKLTGLSKHNIVEQLLSKRLNDVNNPLIFKCVIYPSEGTVHYNGGKPVIIPCGLLDAKIKFVKSFTRNSSIREENVFGFEYGGKQFTFEHNSNYKYGHSYTKKYTKKYVGAGINHSNIYKVDLFVNITKEELQDAIDKHYLTGKYEVNK